MPYKKQKVIRSNKKRCHLRPNDRFGFNTSLAESTWTSVNSTETVVPTHRPGIYNMQGMKMTRNWEALPSGLYIVDGVKRMKK